MYRVELKVLPTLLSQTNLYLHVPNVPCGVESLLSNSSLSISTSVPNVPCGVEREFSSLLRRVIVKLCS